MNLADISLAELARKLKPYIAEWLGGTFGGGSSGGGLSVHELGGVYHEGELTDAQAPQFVMLDGSRELTGNLPVASGKTVDGVDISALDDSYQGHIGPGDPHQVYASADGSGARKAYKAERVTIQYTEPLIPEAGQIWIEEL